MTKYSIDLALVADLSKADQLIAEGWSVEPPYAGKKVTLINAVARNNDCRAIYTSLPGAGGRKHIEVLGFPTDVDWVRTLSRSLEIQMLAGLAAATHLKPDHVHGRTFGAAFVEGFIAEVNHRLHDARRSAIATAQAEAPEATSNRLALVLVEKAHRVDDEFKVRHPRTRTVYTNTRLQSWEGYAPGRAAGRRASLARGSIDGARRSLGA
jgi:hypothetical protein